jgi:hypothetical protein
MRECEISFCSLSDCHCVLSDSAHEHLFLLWLGFWFNRHSTHCSSEADCCSTSCVWRRLSRVYQWSSLTCIRSYPLLRGSIPIQLHRQLHIQPTRRLHVFNLLHNPKTVSSAHNYMKAWSTKSENFYFSGRKSLFQQRSNPPPCLPNQKLHLLWSMVNS